MYIKDLLSFFSHPFFLWLYIFLVSKTWLKENDIHQQIWNQTKLIQIVVRELQMTSYTTVSPTCLLPCWIVCKGINHVHLANHHKLTHKFHTVISDLEKERKEIAINVKVFPLSCILFFCASKPLFFWVGKEKSKLIGTENGYCKMIEQSQPLWHFRVHKSSYNPNQ